MKRTIILTSVLILLMLPLLSAEDWPVKKHEFDNGMRLLVLEDHSTPAINVQIWYHVGSKNERPGITGVSHLFEHMMFMGTEKLEPKEFTRLIQKNGGISNAYTTTDMTVYFEEIGKGKLDMIAELEADRLQNLKINPENLASERQVVLEERGFRYENSPFGDILIQLNANLFLAHPYQWMTIGWRKDIEEITVEDCRNYFETYYNPANAVVVICGDVKFDDAVKIIDKHFGSIPGNPDIPRPIWNEPEQKGERRIDFHKVSQLPIFVAGYHAPPAGHEDSYALDVLTKILSGGESSRAYQRLVYNEQIALFAAGEYEAREQAGVFYAYAAMQPGNTTESGEASLYDEIEKLKKEPVTPEELEKAKNQLEAQFYMGAQSIEQKGSQLGYYETILGDYNILFTEADKYAAVTAEDVMRVAKKYLDPKKRTVITVIQEQQMPPMMGLGEGN